MTATPRGPCPRKKPRKLTVATPKTCAGDLDRAIAAAREAHTYVKHLGMTRAEAALGDLLAALDAARGEAVAFQKAAGLGNTPTEFTLPFRQAVEGTGDLAHEWSDKPHRLIFDLCRYIERNDAAPPAAAAVPATMAVGWRHDICTTLNRVMPSWIAAGKTPIEAACNAIEALAAVACEAHGKPAALAVPEGVLALLRDLEPALDAYERSGRKSEIKDGALHWTLNARHYDAQRLRSRVEVMLAAAPAAPAAATQNPGEMT